MSRHTRLPKGYPLKARDIRPDPQQGPSRLALACIRQAEDDAQAESLRQPSDRADAAKFALALLILLGSYVLASYNPLIARVIVGANP